MAHYLFNFSQGGPEQAAALLRAKLWPVSGVERHRDALAPGDLILIYLAPPGAEFIGQAEVASAAQEWTSAQAEADPGDSPGGVLLSHVEEWDPPVAMSSVLPAVDPEGSNPLVQENAKSGFRAGVIQITQHEYETVLAVRAEGRPAVG
jgi:EVE domain